MNYYLHYVYYTLLLFMIVNKTILTAKSKCNFKNPQMLKPNNFYYFPEDNSEMK